MFVSYGLPVHHMDPPEEFLTAQAITEMAQAAEDAGFAALNVTDHPFPGTSWVTHGGHHALDPLVTLGVAATVTRSIRLHTNLLVLPYRNPFLVAKGLATQDVISGGRTIVGLGGGYLEPEFAALGIDMEERNDRFDQSLEALMLAWTGEPVTLDGQYFRAPDNVMRPVPLQRPRPPLWIGGNSRRAIRRAVDLADGWSPFPNPARWSSTTRTAELSNLEDLAHALDYARGYAADRGRAEPLTICYVPDGLVMGSSRFDPVVVRDSIDTLADLGVDWVAVALPGATRREQLVQIERFATTVLERRAASPPGGASAGNP